MRRHSSRGAPTPPCSPKVMAPRNSSETRSPVRPKRRYRTAHAYHEVTWVGMLRPEYPVRTHRLLLRPLTARDVDGLLAYRSRPDVCRYVPFEPMDGRTIEERLATMWATTALTDEGQALTLGVELASTGELAGDVVL